MCLPEIHAEIAGPKYDYWSSFAPLPLEVVLSASQKAKEEPMYDEQNGIFFSLYLVLMNSVFF